MLTPGLMQPATCGAPTNAANGGACATGLSTTPFTAFRVGVDCPTSGSCVAPLPAPVANLPQPWYPGVNSTDTGAGETIDPNFHPNRSDEFTLSVQHQFGPKILAEAGYIGRILRNEIEYYSLTAVPYMMTRGGQSFANAWANVMVATNYGTNLTNIPVQPFFENSLSSTFCAAYSSCTAAFVQQQAGYMNYSDAFDAFTTLSNAGDWTFGRSMTSDPICQTYGPSCTPLANGANGQSPSITTTVSNGYGNYNAGYMQLTTTSWHGLTAKTEFQYSNALGTGDVVQASSSYSSVDPWNLQNNYGPQYYNEKFTFNAFLNYAEPYYSSQQGIIGRLLGGWSFSPLFVYGSGFPVELNDANGGDCGSFGECNPAYIGAYENMVMTSNWHYSGTEKRAAGAQCGYVGAGYNVFSNPDATCPVNGGIFGDPVRNPILGYDGQIGGGGPVKGLPFFNLDLGVTKNIKIKERLSSSLYFDWTNVLNHMQPNDPCFYDTATYVWGVLGCGGNLQAKYSSPLADRREL